LIETPEDAQRKIFLVSRVTGSGLEVSPQDSLLLRAFEHENPAQWLISQAPRVAANCSRYESAVQGFFSSRAEIDDQIDDFRCRLEVYLSLGVVESIAD
jgi:hypothetical protein